MHKMSFEMSSPQNVALHQETLLAEMSVSHASNYCPRKGTLGTKLGLCVCQRHVHNKRYDENTGCSVFGRIERANSVFPLVLQYNELLRIFSKGSAVIELNHAIV